MSKNFNNNNYSNDKLKIQGQIKIIKFLDKILDNINNNNNQVNSETEGDRFKDNKSN